MAGSIAPLVLRVYGVASAGALAFVLLGSALWAPADAHWMFRVHVSLLSVAFLFAAPTAALAVVARQASGSAEERKWFVNTHKNLQIAAVVAGTCGFLSEYIFRDQREKPHFKSWHSYWGALALLMMAGNMCAGLYLTYFAKKSVLWKDRLHRNSGTVTLAVGGVALVLGYERGYSYDTFGIGGTYALLGLSALGALAHVAASKLGAMTASLADVPAGERRGQPGGSATGDAPMATA